ncbi:MAG: dUTP diphosphatase, partial [Alphaproteobacteria bacterium]|nr:dUTP diphosphatase [Alphaproteobacteria bacterium]
DYRGEIQVILINHGEKAFTIERGMRIAQMVIAPFTQIALEKQNHPFQDEHRGGGFGSTGTHAV